jgi:hypothetical protein
MGPVILVASLFLAAAQQGDARGDGRAATAASSTPAPADAALARPSGRKPRTTSPPGTTPMPPSTKVDPQIQLPPNRAPEKPATPSEPDKPTTDSIKPRDDSVKPVQPAPSKPGEPGVRPL